MKGANDLDYNTFDIIFAEFKTRSESHIQSKRRPCVVIQNAEGNYYAPTLNVIPLTHVIKKLGQKTHGIIRKSSNNGLTYDSMLLGEQIYTIDKTDVIKKIGKIDNEEEQDIICNCFLAILYGKKKVKVVEVV